MYRVAKLSRLCALALPLCVAQTPRTVKFEVASVRLATNEKDADSYMQGGPGTGDPERIVYQRLSFARLLCAAYNVDFDQISGPNWLAKEFYTVTAKLPPGSTSDDLKLMWQDLLDERFHLKIHMDRREFEVYDLSVARGGPKLQKSGDGPARQEPGFRCRAQGRSGRSRWLRRGICDRASGTRRWGSWSSGFAGRL